MSTRAATDRTKAFHTSSTLEKESAFGKCQMRLIPLTRCGTREHTQVNFKKIVQQLVLMMNSASPCLQTSGLWQCQYILWWMRAPPMVLGILSWHG
jgi:hypothetical protein